MLTLDLMYRVQCETCGRWLLARDVCKSWDELVQGPHYCNRAAPQACAAARVASPDPPVLLGWAEPFLQPMALEPGQLAARPVQDLRQGRLASVQLSCARSQELADRLGPAFRVVPVDGVCRLRHRHRRRRRVGVPKHRAVLLDYLQVQMAAHTLCQLVDGDGRQSSGAAQPPRQPQRQPPRQCRPSASPAAAASPAADADRSIEPSKSGRKRKRPAHLGDMIPIDLLADDDDADDPSDDDVVVVQHKSAAASPCP